MILSLDQSVVEDKYISIGDNTHGKEAVQDIYAIPIRKYKKTDKRISRLVKNVMVENRNSISNTKTGINGNKLIH